MRVGALIVFVFLLLYIRSFVFVLCSFVFCLLLLFALAVVCVVFVCVVSAYVCFLLFS